MKRNKRAIQIATALPDLSRDGDADLAVVPRVFIPADGCRPWTRCGCPVLFCAGGGDRVFYGC